MPTVESFSAIAAFGGTDSVHVVIKVVVAKALVWAAQNYAG
jgi:hypothetical protein